MKSFSLLRVAHYARYHYSVTRHHYIQLFVAVLALPVLFGILNRSLHAATNNLVAIYIFGGIAMAVSTTRTMRGRGTKIMDGVLPVSVAERHVFNIFNLTVVYPVVFALVSLLALGIVAPFHVDVIGHFDFNSSCSLLFDEALLLWPIYVLVQIVCSSSLLINILARRSLVFAYVLVSFAMFGCLVMFVSGMEWLSDNVEFSWSFNPTAAEMDAIECTLKTIFCMIPVAIYTLCYVALRKRQVKW